MANFISNSNYTKPRHENQCGALHCAGHLITIKLFDIILVGKKKIPSLDKSDKTHCPIFHDVVTGKEGENLDQKEAEFEYEWLTRQDYEFKLLALLAVLADSHLAYRGTLGDMCDFLGVSTGNSRINKKIKEAIDTLEKDGLLKKIVDGRTFTLTLSKKAEKQRRVIRIQKEWVSVAMHYADMPNKSESVSWMNLLKVWLFLLDRDTQKTKEPISNKKIAEALSMSEGTVKNARGALTKDIQAIISKKKYAFNPDLYQPYRCLGSEITVTAWITDNRPAP